MDAAPLTIHVNKHNWNGEAAHMRSTLMTWEWRGAKARRAGRVQIDFRDVEFMEPWALALFACFGAELRHAGVQIEALLDPANPSNCYFERMGMLDVAAQGRSGPGRNLGPDDTGLQVVGTIRDAERFAARCAELVAGDDEDAAQRVRYCVEELARNAVQHANSPIGAVAIAQRFPQTGHVQVAVCDAGQGVRSALKGFYPELLTDLEALRLAVLPRTSGAAPPGAYAGSGDQNQGLGLFFAREVAWRAGGGLWLASGEGLLGYRSSDENGPTRVYRKINPWHGTLAVVHLPVKSASEFSENLEVCHRLVQEVERDATAAALEFVDAAGEFPDDALVVEVGPLQSDLEQAGRARTERLMPAIADGRQIVLDFGGVRFLSTSIAQALLGEPLRVPGSVTKFAFRNCTRATQAAIRTTAALARAGYRMRP